MRDEWGRGERGRGGKMCVRKWGEEVSGGEGRGRKR